MAETAITKARTEWRRGYWPGVTYCKYEMIRTYIAVVAEVEVKLSTGDIRCTRFYLAHDCGQIINPDGLRNQLEGNVIQTVSRTLKEELKFNRSTVTSRDWASYPILTFPEVPEIVMDLIDRPAEKPWGAGEPAAAVFRPPFQTPCSTPPVGDCGLCRLRQAK